MAPIHFQCHPALCPLVALQHLAEDQLIPVDARVTRPGDHQALDPQSHLPRPWTHHGAVERQVLLQFQHLVLQSLKRTFDLVIGLPVYLPGALGHGQLFPQNVVVLLELQDAFQ
ncbi:MAG: hypothetical protein B7Z66_07185 [Chromatiales bacterium 21-64-14]|nr:MAG: hypothetical protein B7Z66_07185 [Chromatiales bacterium 21-64-14]